MANALAVRQCTSPPIEGSLSTAVLPMSSAGMSIAYLVRVRVRVRGRVRGRVRVEDGAALQRQPLGEQQRDERAQLFL